MHYLFHIRVRYLRLNAPTIINPRLTIEFNQVNTYLILVTISLHEEYILD